MTDNIRTNFCATCKEQADRIEAQAAEIASLKHGLKEAMKLVEGCCIDHYTGPGEPFGWHNTAFDAGVKEVIDAGPQESTTLSEFKDSIRKGGAHD